MTLSPLSMWNLLNVTMSLCHHVIFFGEKRFVLFTVKTKSYVLQ